MEDVGCLRVKKPRPEAAVLGADESLRGGDRSLRVAELGIPFPFRKSPLKALILLQGLDEHSGRVLREPLAEPPVIVRGPPHLVAPPLMGDLV